MYDSRVFLLTLMPIIKTKNQKIKKTAEEETENTVWKNENFKEIVLDQ